MDVWQLLDQSAKIAVAVGVGVAVALDVKLIDDRVFVPQRVVGHKDVCDETVFGTLRSTRKRCPGCSAGSSRT
jgi:hypothetical protein